MKIEIGLKEIPIFKYLDKSDTSHLGAICQVLEYKHGQVILSFGGPVAGLYIVASGEVHVTTAQGGTHLATIARGGSFGEMTLIEPDEASSANIKVASPVAELIFCRKEAFYELLGRDQSFRASFYQGASALLSQRLRQTNDKISKQLAPAHNLIKALVEPMRLFSSIGKTRQDVIATSVHMTGKLFDVLPQLAKLADKCTSCHTEISDIHKLIEGMLLVETQNFDKIAQQLELLTQYVGNIDRVLRGEEPLAIRGDQQLFYK